MADQPRISFLLGPPLPSQEDDDEHKKEERRPVSPYQSENSKTFQENSVNGTNEDSAADEPQLVPTAPIPSTASKEQSEQPATTDTFKSPAKPSTSPDDAGRDVLEVPDSQEPKPSREEKRIFASEEKRHPKSQDTSARRKEKRKAPQVPTNNDAVDVAGSKPEEDHISVEIQVEATPPPSEPERPKKSPRGKRKT